MRFPLWVLWCVLLAAPSVLYALPSCSDLCPTAVLCSANCQLAPGEPSVCADWCNAHPGACTCSPCPNDCDNECYLPGRDCNSPCTFWNGFTCNPTECGENGVTEPPACVAEGGWKPQTVGYDCCNGTDSCTCDDYRFFEYQCVGPICEGTWTGGEYTDMFNCLSCDDGNPCTTNDCSAGVCGGVDNSYSQACYYGPPGTLGVGECSAGVETCSGGAFGGCIGEVTPVAEICDNNGVDDDCDGNVDENCECAPPGVTQACYGGPAGTQDVGLCRAGLRECSGLIPCTGTHCWTVCGGQVLPTEEVCDNQDNNCDGTIDNILENCYTGPPITRNVGACQEGVRGCSAGVWGDCGGEVIPIDEICGNSIDDDCDGDVDEGCAGGCAGPETCNGLDDDCDGAIDSPLLLSVAQVCAAGAIYPRCGGAMACEVGKVCMQPAGYCSDDLGGCAGNGCPAPLTCYLGSCFDSGCSGHAMCDPGNTLCYNNGLCLDATDPCAGMNCPAGQICYKGACYDPCAGPADCSMPLLCYDGRCAEDPCMAPDGTPVACPFDEICYGGNCFDPCTLDDECGPDSFCPAGRCAETNCQDVQCPAGEVCQGGNCAPGCSLQDCTPPEVCFADTFCAAPDVDLCDTAQCGQKPCHKGVCYDACTVDADCPAGQRCYDGRCVDLVAGPCDRVSCPQGEACLGGDCHPICPADGDCSDPGSFCYQQVCVDSECSPGKCQPNEVCYRGVCFLGCGSGAGGAADISCPDPLSCYAGEGPPRCAPSACEAMDSVTIASYNANHPFREHDMRLRSYQQNRPWNYPRPYRTTSSPQAWTQITGNFSTHPMHRGKAARVSFVYHNGPERYSVYLSHGSLDLGQNRADAVYSIHIDGASPNVQMTDDEGAEAYERSGDGDTRHIQAMITTTGPETGGILIGPFEADDEWSMEIYAAFYGPGITSWELMNGETGSTQQVLDPYYPLIIRNEDLDSDDYFDDSMGTTCAVKSAKGICSQGSWVDCQYYGRVCLQTVGGMGGELCNGEDDNCNGQIDEITHMVVPTVQYRQSPGGYRQWLTYDTDRSVAGETHKPLMDPPNTLNYTPSSNSDDRVGYVTINLPFDGAVQDNSNQSHVFAHRNLVDGRLSFPFVHGKSEAMMGWTARDFELDISPLSYGDSRDISVPWYEDRKPGSTSDSIYKDYDLDGDVDENKVEARFNVVARAGVVETDTIVVGVRPLTALDWTTANPDRRSFRVDFDYAGINPYDWLLRWPDNLLSLDTQKSLQFRVRPSPISETFCRSHVPTATCNVGKYVCIAGELRCTPSNDVYCTGCKDNDGDGQDGYDPVFCPSGTDCDDDDPETYLGAPERCNGKDNSCNGLVDQATIGCPGGSDVCGPEECGFNNLCVCPENGSCYCGEGLGH